MKYEKLEELRGSVILQVPLSRVNEIYTHGKSDLTGEWAVLQMIQSDLQEIQMKDFHLILTGV